MIRLIADPYNGPDAIPITTGTRQFHDKTFVPRWRCISPKLRRVAE